MREKQVPWQRSHLDKRESRKCQMQWHTIAITATWITITNETIQVLLASHNALVHLHIPSFTSVGDLWQNAKQTMDRLIQGSQALSWTKVRTHCLLLPAQLALPWVMLCPILQYTA